MKQQIKVPFFVLIIVFTLSYSCSSNQSEQTVLIVEELKKDTIDLVLNSNGKVNIDSIIFECDYLGEIPPTNKPRLFAPNTISTGDLHSSVYFTPNGKEIYYSRLSSKGDNSGVIMRRNIDGNWSNETMIPATEDALTPFVSLDGERLFCSLPRTLFVMNRNGVEWGEPQNLGKEINFQKRQDGLSESRNRTIYYTAMFGENNGTFSSKYIDGKYQKPEKIETGLAGKFKGGYPYIAPDESYIIVQARQSKGFGAQDLYIMFKKEDGSWTNAINMGDKINTTASESFPYVTPDGKYFFFNSNRISKVNSKVRPHFYGNIYWVNTDIIHNLKNMHLNNSL